MGLILVGPLLGQQPLGGYGAGEPLAVAPGQLVTVFVSDFGAEAELPARAGPLPLPTRLQAGDGSLGVILVSGFNELLPILKADRVSPNQVAMTVRMPWRLADRPFPVSWVTAIWSSPGISGSALCREFGARCSRRLDLSVRRSAVHLLRTCDSVLDQPTTVPSCAALITRRDGSIVSEQAPVRFGEELTAWAVGLGEPSDMTGSPPSAGALIDGVSVNVQFCGTAVRAPASDAPAAEYSGLVDAEVGLYQVNFRIPGDASGDASCATKEPLPLQARVTVGRSIGGAVDSFDAVEVPFLR